MATLHQPNSAGPRRLSKPRVNTSVPDWELDHASPSIPSNQQDYFGDHAVVVALQGERRTTGRSRSRIRAYLHGPAIDAMGNASDDEDVTHPFVGAARDVKKRLSQTGSSIMQLQSAKTSTARLSNSSTSKLQHSGSQSSDVEESAILADQIKERAYQDRIAAQNHVVSPVDENKHVDSVMAPVRRKSLYTPGLATRNPSDILRKPTQVGCVELQFDRDYYYDPSKPKESPLSQLAALQFPEDGRSTPSNMNYPQLGGLQLGTLRVTNGAASPLPPDHTPNSICRTLSNKSMSYDVYHAGTEGTMVGEHHPSLPPNDRIASTKERKYEFPVSAANQIKIMPCESSQRTYPDYAVSMANEYMSELGGSPFAYPDISGIESDNDCGNDEAVEDFRGDSLATQSKGIPIGSGGFLCNGHQTQEEALCKLNGTLALASNYGHVHHSSASQSVISYHDSPIGPFHADSGYGSKASLDMNTKAIQNNTVEADSSNISQKSLQTTPDQASRTPNSPGMVPVARYRSLSGPRNIPLGISGYETIRFHGIGQPPLQCVSPTLLPNPSAVKGQPAACSPTRRSIRKLHKSRPQSQPLLPTVVGQSCRGLDEVHIPRVPSIMATKHAERLSQFPLLDHTFPSSQHTTMTDSSSSTEPSKSVYPAPIRFPSPANALEAAATGDPTEHCRLEGEETCRQRARSKSRIRSGILQLSRSRASSKHRGKLCEQEQDDDSPATDIVRSPSWSDFGRGRQRREQRRLSKQEKVDHKRLVKEEKELEKRLRKDRQDFENQAGNPEGRTKHARSRSTSKRRGRSVEGSSDNGDMLIADFGTVAESLGESPYDITTSMFSRPVHRGNNWHPHQISTAISRPKSVIGGAKTTTAQPAPARSRTRSQSFGRPGSPFQQRLVFNDDKRENARPRSMIVNANTMPAIAAVDLKTDWADFQVADGSVRRAVTPNDGSLSGYCNFSEQAGYVEGKTFNVPPLPPFPSPERVKQQEAQIRKTHVKSIIIDTVAPPAPASSQCIESRRSKGMIEVAGSDLLGSYIVTKPEKSRASKILPDLWTSGSLERKVSRSLGKPGIVDATVDMGSAEDDCAVPKMDKWEAQRQAWRTRRKSAGEALLRNQVGGVIGNAPVTLNNTAVIQEQEGLKPTSNQDLTATHELANRPDLKPFKSFPKSARKYHPTQQKSLDASLDAAPAHPTVTSQRPISDIMTNTQQKRGLDTDPVQPHSAFSDLRSRLNDSSPAHSPTSTFSIARKRIGSSSSTPTTSINRVIGRYNGGLLYGYEPGCGLGGSAGTRGTKTEASRKSLQVSKGFGLDLSDVPIFVAPATTTTR